MSVRGAARSKLPDGRAGGADGYTLIEVVTVIGIIGVLAVIAIATYQNYRNKAQTVEARLGLHNIYLLEESFRRENGRYSASLGEIGFQMIGRQRYAYSVQATVTSFTARATANLDRDGDLDVWEIYFSNLEPAHLLTD